MYVRTYVGVGVGEWVVVGGYVGGCRCGYGCVCVCGTVSLYGYICVHIRTVHVYVCVYMCLG